MQRRNAPSPRHLRRLRSGGLATSVPALSVTRPFCFPTLLGPADLCPDCGHCGDSAPFLCAV